MALKKLPKIPKGLSKAVRKKAARDKREKQIKERLALIKSMRKKLGRI